MVDSIASTVQINLNQTASGAVPSKPKVPADAPLDGSRKSSDLSGWICLAVGLIFLVWLSMAVFRPFFREGSMPGGGPGGGGYGPVRGGGGFFSSLLGSLFGAAAGNWMYDSFFRGGNRGPSLGDTSSPSVFGPSDPDALPADEAGGGAFGGDADDAGGGGFGSDDSTGDNGGFDDGGGGDFGGDSSWS